jgi:hypothetical protein
MNAHETREGWLLAARRSLETRFFCSPGETLPERVACGCGWMRASSKAIGQCFPASRAADKTIQIWICPTQDEPVSVLATLLHELGHAAVGVEHAHKKPFRAFQKRVGLAGKPTATFAEPGTELHKVLEALATELGPYPHKSVSKGGKKVAKAPTWIRMMSLSDPAYRLVIRGKALDEHGPPVDPWGDEMVIVEKES